MKFIKLICLLALMPFAAFAGPNEDLLAAAQKGDFDKVKAAVEAGADVNAKGTADNTALHFAAYYGYNDIALYLIEHKANVNADNSIQQRALAQAGTKAKEPVAKALLAAGADVNAVDKLGNTALATIIVNGHVDVVKMLLAAGAKPDVEDKLGQTPLMKLTLAAEPAKRVEQMKAYEAYGGLKDQRAEYYSSTGELSKALLDAGANPNRNNKAGETILMKAAQNGKNEMVKNLIAAKADVNALSKTGQSALVYACDSPIAAEAGKYLLEAGADPNIKFSRIFSFYFTSKDGRLDAEYRNVTPLMVAARSGNNEMVKALAAAKADMNAVGTSGGTKISGYTDFNAAFVADQYLHDDTYALLVSLGTGDLNKRSKR
ncbi:MAG: ankyrin repeat domain-containing protein [Bacteroidota bacterium]